MTRRGAMTRGYMIGLIMAALMSCLLQDFLGLEEYIDLCRRKWVYYPWWVWVYCILLLCGIAFLQIRKARKEDERRG